jgi:hypothetical protein
VLLFLLPLLLGVSSPTCPTPAIAATPAAVAAAIVPGAAAVLPQHLTLCQLQLVLQTAAAAAAIAAAIS